MVTDNLKSEQGSILQDIDRHQKGASRLYERLACYDLIIFDMDGTLYFQRGMQIRMALRLIKHCVSCKRGFKDISLILKYRKLREEWDSSQAIDDDELYHKLEEQTGMSSDTVGEVIQEWMFDNPMDVVRQCRDKALLGVIDRLVSDGKRVCIYSDYPTEDKCDAVGLSEDMPQYYCGQDEIKTMKPNPSALFYIMSEYPETVKEKVIMVGDRADRDKAAADNAGIASLILGRFKVFRYFH